MRYVSTRGAAPSVGFSDALLQALAPDGGLYVPEVWPRLEGAGEAGTATASYAETAGRILKAFAGADLSEAEALADAEAAYLGFSTRAVAPLRQLEGRLWLLELFHGPTLAFKDIAMQLLARLYDRVLERSGERLTIVCATSGDTGGAAIEAFAGSARVRVLALFPEGRVSEVQRRFMTTNPAPNVAALAVKGDFDDCQRILKALFADGPFARTVGLSGVNSINIARIIAQSVYYATSLSALGGHETAAFAVPTGNFGDAFAAEAARRMGFGVRRVIVATNSNDILARAFSTGLYARGPSIETQSPAMDIQVASNFERLYFELCGRDASLTRSAFEGFAAGGDIAVPLETIAPLFTGRAVGEEETSSLMRTAYDRYGLLIDPHTAVALAAAGAGPCATPLIVLSTAHPAKFPDAVERAVGRRPDLPESRRGIFERGERFNIAPANVEAVKAEVLRFARA